MGLEGNNKVYYYKGGVVKGVYWGKRISIYIILILFDQASNRRLLMDIYKNNIFIHFLVCVPAISAQAWRYHRFVTGTIELALLRGGCQYFCPLREGIVRGEFLYDIGD